MNDFENISDISLDGFPLLNKRYKLIKKIGEGSYGVVYKAADKNNNDSLVAIKQISKIRINSNPYLIEALQRELYIMRLLSDKNSVKLIEDFETEDNYNLVMELCDSDLDIELKKRKSKTKSGFNELEVQAIMNQFNNIFKKMQKGRVIHRDLKLKNIMIKYDKNVEIIGFILKLSDFGFSKVMNEDDVTGTNLGSPATKAPEIMKGSDYNAKADLWSIGVIMYQLFFDQLPFPARTARELKEAIFRSRGVRLPIGKEDSMTQICFDLIDKLLQKEPEKRIEFEEYFNHKFFSEEHKKNLIEKIKNNEKNEKIVYKNINNENIIQEESIEDSSEEVKKSSNDSNTKNNNNKNRSENKNNIYNLNNIIDFEKRFLKILILKEYKMGYKLYKAKDISNDKYVFIKEIKKSIIDDNPIFKKIFSKEIKLLSELKGKKFPEFFGLFISDEYYNIVMEYFDGNNLYDFINYRNNLDADLIILILKQLKTSIIELYEKKIILEFISPKNFTFTYYQNNSNFEIKFFDYGLSTIFYDEKFIKKYLLEESKLGNVENSSINVLSMGLTIYKMLFGEEALVKNAEEDYEITIKRKLTGEYAEKIKIFLSRCIKKYKRYTWKEFYQDDFLNDSDDNQISLSDSEKIREPKIKNEVIEILLEIIIKKMNYIINNFKKFIKEKKSELIDKTYLEFYEEIIIFLSFCSLECKTIIKFLKINADTPQDKIDENNQDINIFKIFINKNDKDNNKYDYSHINLKTENKNNLLYLYNKENPSFSYYLKIFCEIEKKISLILNKLSDKNNLFYSQNQSNSESKIYGNDSLKSKSDNINIRHAKEGTLSQKGNMEQLFMNYFEDGVLFYTNQKKDKAIEKLKIAKYILEYIIFQRIILGNKDKTIAFDKLMIKNEDKEKSNEEENTVFVTFIGEKIRELKKDGILGYNSGSISGDLNDINDPQIENIKIYDNMINFYPRIIQFIAEINKEKN